MTKAYRTLSEDYVRKAYGNFPECVAYSGLSRTSLYNALKKGDLTAKKAGRRTLISFAELDRYLSDLPEYRSGV